MEVVGRSYYSKKPICKRKVRDRMASRREVPGRRWPFNDERELMFPKLMGEKTEGAGATGEGGDGHRRCMRWVLNTGVGGGDIQTHL